MSETMTIESGNRPSDELNQPSIDIVRSPELVLDFTHALIAPGQGSFRLGMGQDLAQRSPAAARRWAASDAALYPIIGRNLTDIAWHGTEEELARTENQQPAIITDALARRDALEETGQLDNPGWHAGYSLGSVVALINAGSLTPEAAIQLMKGRMESFADAIRNNPPTTMMAVVNVDPELTEALMKEYGLVTCIVSTDKRLILGGEVPNVEQAIAHLRDERGLKDNVFPFAAGAAYHSKFMEAAVPNYAEVVHATPITQPTRGKVVFGSTGREATTPDEIRQALIDQITTTENWRDVIKYLHEKGVVTMTELNSVATLTAMNRELLEGSRNRLAYPARTPDEKPLGMAHRWLAPAAA